MKRALLVAAGVALAVRTVEKRYADAVASDPRADDVAPVTPDEVRTVTAPDGSRLHVELSGPVDAPVVVLAHGWTCATPFWAAQVRALKGDHRVVAYDHRAHGRSTGDHAAFSTDVLGDDLQAVLTSVLAEGQRAVLVGHSMGAMAIAAWAGRHPAEVQRLASAAVLLNTGLDSLVQESTYLPGRGRVAVGARRHLMGRRDALVGPVSVTAKGLRRLAFAPGCSAAALDLCTRMMRETDRHGRASWARVMGDLHLLEEVRSLTVPTTVVTSDLDRLTPPVYARRFAAELPQLVELVELTGVGHMSPLEAPGAVSAIIRSTVQERAAA